MMKTLKAATVLSIANRSVQLPNSVDAFTNQLIPRTDYMAVMLYFLHLYTPIIHTRSFRSFLSSFPEKLTLCLSLDICYTEWRILIILCTSCFIISSSSLHIYTHFQNTQSVGWYIVGTDIQSFLWRLSFKNDHPQKYYKHVWSMHIDTSTLHWCVSMLVLRNWDMI